MKKLDPEMKALFEQIGIDDQSNVDEETIDFIYDFVDKHGGVEALRKELPSKPPGNTGEITLTIASYGKCSKISNTFLFLFFNKLFGYQGWNSQTACRNSKQGIPRSDCFVEAV